MTDGHDFIPVGTGRLPDSERRALRAPGKVADHPIAKRIQELLVHHPDVVEFRDVDLDEMDEATLRLLLSDIEGALRI